MPASTPKTSPESFVMVPRSVMEADVSPRAKEVWMRVASYGNIYKPEVPAIVWRLAQLMRVEAHAVSRAIGELLRAGLLVFKDKFTRARSKIYTIPWYKNLLHHRTKTFHTPEHKSSLISNKKEDLKIKKQTKIYQERLIHKQREWAKLEKPVETKGRAPENRNRVLEKAKQSIPKEVQQALFDESLAEVAKSVRKKPEQLLVSSFYRDGIEAMVAEKILARLKHAQANTNKLKSQIGS